MTHDTIRLTPDNMYRGGLACRMYDYAIGAAHIIPPPEPIDGDPLRAALREGYADADDDSDEPRPDDPAALQALAREVFAEIARIGADVSAWADFARWHICLDDGLAAERHDPESLLATLRGLTAGAGTIAMWEATRPIAVSCLTWDKCAVVTDGGAP